MAKREDDRAQDQRPERRGSVKSVFAAADGRNGWSLRLGKQEIGVPIGCR